MTIDNKHKRGKANQHSTDNFRQLLINQLMQGYGQSEISKMFYESGIQPNSVSSIEKEIKRLKNENNAKSMFHLGAILASKITKAKK